MPASQKRSNFAFRFGLRRLATTPTANSGFKTRESLGMRRTYEYVEMTKEEVQRSRWTFYEVAKF